MPWKCIFVSPNCYSYTTKKVRPIFNGPSISLFGATLTWVWHHSFCPSYHPQNGCFTTIKVQIKHNSADSCTLFSMQNISKKARKVSKTDFTNNFVLKFMKHVIWVCDKLKSYFNLNLNFIFYFRWIWRLDGGFGGWRPRIGFRFSTTLKNSQT